MLVDEWVSDPAVEPTLSARVDLAVARARERRRVVRRSCTDVLTGLPNRRELLRAAVQLAARAQRTGEALALVLLDLDQFKEVNDRSGHPEGDRVLRRVGMVLRREVRQGEVCGRIGGDEFALVLTGGLTDAALARDRLVAALREAGVSASGGIAVSRGGRRLRHLYADADAALLAAKRGRPRASALPRVHSRWKEVESNDQLSMT
ncbi:MAG: GGDEF domain-containing protein [Archangiaceae bacterium]|nr:GGDEF domain-containing protein [Archangiaceae bacterium]